MTMPGPPPKPPGQRRRRNVQSTSTVIAVPDQPAQLPFDLADYRPQVQMWIREAAASAMSTEWTRVDAMDLLIVAELMETFWALPREKATSRAAVAAEIRQRLVEMGLTPLARRRLQWTIANAEDATAKTESRKALPARRRPDPRLKAV